MHEFELPEMSCGHCASAVDRACRTIDEKAQVEVDLGARKVRVASGQHRADFAQALSEAGYPPAW